MSSRKAAPRDLHVQIASTDSSPRVSAQYHPIYDGQDVVMADGYSPTRSLSVEIPSSLPSNLPAQGSYCNKKPNLSEILANESPAPWTLSAFMAYLSQNHCLETLEFTMDAARYSKHYAKTLAREASGSIAPYSEQADYLKMLWTRLMDAYITPNGPREVNISSETRHDLLHLVQDYQGLPPPPEALDNAVQHVYALMEESVLVPFLNSGMPQSAHPGPYRTGSSEQLTQPSVSRHFHTQSASAHPFSSQSNSEYYRRSSPNGSNPLHSTGVISPPLPTSDRALSSSNSSTLRGPSNRHSAFAGPASRYVTSPFSMIDNDPLASDESLSTSTSLSLSQKTSHASKHSLSGSLPSHEEASVEWLQTPPNTPPMSDFHTYEGSPGMGGTSNADVLSSSPRENTWKRMGRTLGLRRSGRRASGGSPEGTIHEDD